MLCESVLGSSDGKPLQHQKQERQRLARSLKTVLVLATTGHGGRRNPGATTVAHPRAVAPDAEESCDDLNDGE